ncbi:MAG: hypothetical protein L0177_16665 [Chloroflexi bacterium]|nr:hypothetical protein [Chloroflexota bacterium]
MKITAAPKKVLAIDTEVANRWWWYDGKSTHRLMIFVGQWVARAEEVQRSGFGWILLPDILFESPKILKKYAGLPVVQRRSGLGLISRAISDADVCVGHNLTGFDWGTINGELLIQNMPLLQNKELIDTLNGGPKGVFQQRSLANRMSRLPGHREKPHVDPVVWEAAFNEFDPDALREVWNRALADVQLHVDLYLNDLERSYV